LINRVQTKRLSGSAPQRGYPSRYFLPRSFKIAVRVERVVSRGAGLFIDRARSVFFFLSSNRKKEKELVIKIEANTSARVRERTLKEVYSDTS
jgi:hypothetical protein